jgi:ABC-type phosphate/phosphonate transport system ATPase subunit
MMIFQQPNLPETNLQFENGLCCAAGYRQGQAKFIEHIQADEEEMLMNALKELKGKGSSSSRDGA